MSQAPESENAPAALGPDAPAGSPLPLTRSQRRAQRDAALPLPPVTSKRPLAVVATVALSALIALSGFAYPVLVALAVGLGGLVLAWGWPRLLASPSPRGSTAVLAFGTLACVSAVALTPTDPFLRWMPAALAVSLIAAFLHQLVRRDGRPRLTESVAITAAGLAVVSSGAAYIALPRTLAGEGPLAAAMAALGLSALADTLVTSQRLRPWALTIAMGLGGAAAAAVGIVHGRPSLAPAVLLGVLMAAVAHATRRILAVLPPMVSARSQLVSGATSVLLAGVVAYVLARVVIA